MSILKNRLLEIVRDVESGNSYEITKDSRPVALLVPLPTSTTSPVNFAKLAIVGGIAKIPEQDWSFDVDNLDSAE